MALSNTTTTTRHLFTAHAHNSGHVFLTSLPMPTSGPAGRYYIPDHALILTGISCCASILGCVGIFITFWRFPEYRSNSRKLLLYLTVADIFTAVGNLTGVVRYYVYYKLEPPAVLNQCDAPNIICKVQSFVTTCSNLCSFFWMCVISFYFVLAIVNHDVRTAEKLMIPSHVICWGLPVLLVSLAAGFNVLGEDLSYTSGGWCWITECSHIPPGKKIAWMLATGKFWEFATYIILIINYALLKYHVWKQGRRMSSLSRQGLYRSNGEYLDHRDQLFVFVPIILLVLRIWGTVKFIVTSIYLNESVVGQIVYYGQEVLTVLQGIGDSFQGFWNFVLFCVLTKDIRKKLFSCKKQPRDQNLVDSLQGDEDVTSSEEDGLLQGGRSSGQRPNTMT